MTGSNYLRHFDGSQRSYLYRHKFEKKSVFSSYSYNKNYGYYTCDIFNGGSNGRLGR